MGKIEKAFLSLYDVIFVEGFIRQRAHQLTRKVKEGYMVTISPKGLPDIRFERRLDFFEEDKPIRFVLFTESEDGFVDRLHLEDEDDLYYSILLELNRLSKRVIPHIIESF